MNDLPSYLHNMFSSLNVSGLFLLTRFNSAEGNLLFQSLGNQPTTTLNGLNFTYYNSEVTCTDGQSISAKICVRSNSPAALLPNDAAAYLTGTAFIDTDKQESYIDATCVKFIKESSDLPRDATFLSTYFDCLGTVCGDSYVLDDEDASVVFPVLARVCILDDIKSTRLMYVFFPRLTLIHSFSQVHVLWPKSSLGYHPCPFSGH